jgi:hypothetical protein
MHLHHYIDGQCSGDGARPGPCGERQTYRRPQPPSLSDRIAAAQSEVDRANEVLEYHLTLSGE